MHDGSNYFDTLNFIQFISNEKHKWNKCSLWMFHAKLCDKNVTFLYSDKIVDKMDWKLNKNELKMILIIINKIKAFSKKSKMNFN